MDTRGLPELRDRVVSLGRLRQLGFAGDSTGEERTGQRGFRDLQRVRVRSSAEHQFHAYYDNN